MKLRIMEIILRIEMNLIQIRIFKQVPKYSVTRLQKPSEEYSSPAEVSIQGIKCKILRTDV
jgi:hypothetical protein